jgi:tRNA(Ile)-lysidine synthetase-like protein
MVGVSGGLDSRTLLHVLAETGRTLFVAHFDHGWRKEGREEAAFVRDCARQAGARFFLGKAPPGLKRSENEARKARYAFFSKVAKTTRCPDLVLAHHERDQAETFLLQLFRGGGSGAHGMSPRQDQNGLVLHRPWLDLPLHLIRAYAIAKNLTWREDPTNEDPTFLRNKIRSSLLPWLEAEIRPDIVHHLAQAARILGDEQAWLESLLPAPGLRLSVESLRILPVAAQRRVLRLWLRGQAVADLSFEDIESVRLLLHQVRPAKVNLAQNRFARRTSGELWLC